ncbi:MAG: amidase [Deltaproteobacteria bacterium]|nr:amidase [Deltaproteobacteria bacterium]
MDQSNQDETADLSLAHLARLIRQKELTSAELVQIYLDRIARFDGPDGLNAYLTVAGEVALQRAEELDRLAEQGRWVGPLHGLPIALKDNIDTAGMRTTCGSKILEQWRPAEDAHVVKRLKEAGAIILGKTNMHEFGWGVTTNNHHFGPTRNPYQPDHIPGGSSGGSAAAVSAALCAGALGGDSGGSIRIPAALCGVVGLKPSRGLVGRSGAAYFSFTRDCIGPITRTVADAAIMLEAIAGYDPDDPDTSKRPLPPYSALAKSSLKGKRFGLPREYFFDLIHPDTEKVVDQAVAAIKELGGVVTEVQVKHLDLAAATTPKIIRPEFVYHLEEQLRAFDPQATVGRYLEQMAPDVRRNIAVEKGGPESKPVPGYVYLKAVREDLKKITAAFDEAISGLDALILPTTPLSAPPINDEQEAELGGQTFSAEILLTRNNEQFNNTGYPAITVPAGYCSQGLPVGLQMAARCGEDEKLLDLAYAFEQATTIRRPPRLACF